MTDSFWRWLKSWMDMRPYQWPEGTPLMSGSVRWGTRLEDGTIVGASGVSFTLLPICSRCQQAIEAEAKQNDAAKAEHHAENTRLPRISGGCEAGPTPVNTLWSIHWPTPNKSRASPMINPGTNFTGADATAISAPAIATRIHQCRSSNSFGKSIMTPSLRGAHDGIPQSPFRICRHSSDYCIGIGTSQQTLPMVGAWDNAISHRARARYCCFKSINAENFRQIVFCKNLIDLYFKLYCIRLFL